MLINNGNIQANIDLLARQGRRTLGTVESANSPIDRSFSSIRGVDEVGAIHERVIASDPGSAQNSLRGFAGQLEWLTRALSAEAQGFEQQEDANHRAMTIADAGGHLGSETVPVVDQPEPGYSPFGFAMPIVDVGPDLMGLAFDLVGTKIWSVSEANSRWKSLSEEVQSIVDGLQGAADSLESENSSEATAAAAAKIREVAASGTYFVSNAAVMREKLFVFQAKLIGAQPMAMALAGAAMSIPEPAAREAAKQAGLAKMQARLQENVIAAMPFQNALMDAAPAGGGGIIETGLGSIDGDGSTYDTTGLAWPKAVAEAITAGRVGPGSLQVADGEITGLEGVGMDEAELAGFQDEMRRSGREMLSELGFGDVLPIEAGQVATAGAQVGNIPQANLGPSGAVLSAPPASAGALGAGMGASASTMGMPIGVMAGSSAGAARAGAVGAGARGGSALGTGVGGMATHTGMPPIAGGGAAPTTGQVVGAAGRGVATSAGTGGSNARGMIPVMAGQGRGGQENSKRIKSVTSQIERDPNRQALLGDRPPVVPGVIGDWVRHEPS